MRSVLDSRWRFSILLTACLVIAASFAVRPRALSLAIPISQNFDGMGASATAALPTDFRVDKLGSGSARTVGSYAAATAVTALVGGNALSTSASNGIYNFGAGIASSATDRAVGFLSSGTGTVSGNLYLKLTNNTDAPVSGLPVSYNVEKYRAGTNAAGFRIQLFYSFDGAAWVSAGDNFKTAFAGDIGSNSGYASAPGSTVEVSSTLGVTIPAGSDFYLAWNYSVASGTTSTNAQALAIDDIKIGSGGGSPSTSSPTGIGAAAPAAVPAGNTTLLTVAVTPGANPPSTGLAVSVDLSPIGGSASQALVDDGTNGDVAAGDNVFSYQAAVPATTAAGAKTLIATVSDAQLRTTTAAIGLTVDLPPPAPLAIHEIQASGGSSPYVDTRVSTTGIVTALKSNGFFIQADTPDGDATTSEGIFVYTGGTPPSAAAAGNLVGVVGFVQEYSAQTGKAGSMTEIAKSPSVTLISSGHALPTPIKLTANDTKPNGGIEQLERYEGMLVSVDSLTAVGPSSSSGQFYVVVTGVGRPFREPGLDPLGDLQPTVPANIPHFDGNPERLLVDSAALVGGTALAVTSGATITGVVGPLDFYSSSTNPGSYSIDCQGVPTVNGNLSAVPVPDVADGQFTVASWNMLTFGSGDVVRMNKASLAIRDVLHMPDIIGVEEVNAGDTLQNLAAKVNADAGSPSPGYSAIMLATTGTQNVGFLVKSSVTVTSVEEVGRDATIPDPRDSTKKIIINDRPPVVLRATVADPRGGPAFPVTVIVNHMRSLIDVDTDSSTGVFARAKRRAGAEFLAGLVQQYQTNGERVVSVGDYNAFQFNDGYVDVIGTILGAPTPADQVLLPSPDVVEPNLSDLVDVIQDPEQRYSYVENGSAQTLDHILVSASLMPRVAGLAYGRIDADFPLSLAADGTRPERTSDHDPAVAYFTFPTADLALGASAAPASPVLPGSAVTYTVTVTNGAADDAMAVTLTDTLPAGATFVSANAPAGWTCDTISQTVTCQAASLAAKSDAVFSIIAALDNGLPSGDLTNAVSVDAATYDPNPSNNAASVVTTVFDPPPAIAGALATPAVLWPINHKFVAVTIDYSATDNSGVPPACALDVSSSEPTDGRGDGHTATDWTVVGAHRVSLRAERAGAGSGRTYTIAITCRDANGNSSAQNVFVTAPKGQKK
jgi:uncharacterized protein